MVYRVCECGESDQSQFKIRRKRQKDGAYKEWVEKKCKACLRKANTERRRKSNSGYLNPQLTEDEKLFNKVLQNSFSQLSELLGGEQG